MPAEDVCLISDVCLPADLPTLRHSLPNEVCCMAHVRTNTGQALCATRRKSANNDVDTRGRHILYPPIGKDDDR